MAARSEALAAKGWIDPTKLGKFRVVLSDSLRGKPSSEIYTAVQYNHKPALSTGKPPASAQLEASTTSDASYDLSFDGGSGDQYAYKGTRSTEKGKYALVFDKKTRTFVLHEVDSTFKMNLVETPANKDADSLKERFPYLKRTKGGGIEKRKKMEIKKRKLPDKVADKAQEKMAAGGTKSSEASSASKPKDATSSKANPLIAKKSEKSKAAAQKAASQKLQSAPQPMTHPLPPKPPPTAHGYSGKSSRPSSKSNASTSATATTAAAAAAAATGASSSSMLPPPLPRSRPGQTQMAPPPRPKGSSMSPPPGSGARREEIPLPPKPQFTNLPNKKQSAKASMSPPPAQDRSVASAKAARDRSPDTATSQTAKSSSKTVRAAKAGKASKNAKASLPLPPRPTSPQEAEPAAGKKKNKKPVQYESDEDEDDDDGGLVLEFPGGPSSKSFGNKNDFSPAFPPPVPIRPFSEFEREEPDEDEADEDLEQEFEAVFNEVDQDDEEKTLGNFKLPSPVNNGGAASSNEGPELAVDDDELEREFMMNSDESEISEEE